MIQRLQHGTTVIHYDPHSGRSVLCRLILDASCSTVSWHRIYFNTTGKEGREKVILFLYFLLFLGFTNAIKDFNNITNYSNCRSG